MLKIAKVFAAAGLTALSFTGTALAEADEEPGGVFVSAYCETAISKGASANDGAHCLRQLPFLINEALGEEAIEEALSPASVKAVFESNQKCQAMMPLFTSVDQAIYKGRSYVLVEDLERETLSDDTRSDLAQGIGAMAECIGAIAASARTDGISRNARNALDNLQQASDALAAIRPR